VREQSSSGLYKRNTKELCPSASGNNNEYGMIVSILCCKCNQMQKVEWKKSGADVGETRGL